jgi:hypothetical protein
VWFLYFEFLFPGMLITFSEKNSIVKAAFYDLRESESADKYQNLCSKYIQNGSSKVRFILCV